jgi:quercetin dioxygenase-like cupin family protein
MPDSGRIDVGETSGTDTRAGRGLEQALMRFDLAEQLENLAAEPPGNDPDRQTITLAKTGSFRVVLTALAAGTEIGGDETHGALSILALRGAVALIRGDRAERLEPEQVAIIDRGGPWRARAEEDSALLLTVSWPEESAEAGRSLGV